MIVQGGIGYGQYFSHLPALLVAVHVFGATIIWMAMLWFFDGLTHHGRPGTEPRRDETTGLTTGHATAPAVTPVGP
jgi:cytochrome c oxidase assembly protein subunit 15